MNLFNVKHNKIEIKLKYLDILMNLIIIQKIINLYQHMVKVQISERNYKILKINLYN